MNEELLKLIREFKGTIQFSWVEDMRAYRVRVVRGLYRRTVMVGQREIDQATFDVLFYETQKAVRLANHHADPAGVAESVSPDGTATVKLDSPNETWRNRPAML